MGYHDILVDELDRAEAIKDTDLFLTANDMDRAYMVRTMAQYEFFLAEYPDIDDPRPDWYEYMIDLIREFDGFLTEIETALEDDDVECLSYDRYAEQA